MIGSASITILETFNPPFASDTKRLFPLTSEMLPPTFNQSFMSESSVNRAEYLLNHDSIINPSWLKYPSDKTVKRFVVTTLQVQVMVGH